MAEESHKLTKKQLKALQFKAKNSDKAAQELEEAQKKQEETNKRKIEEEEKRIKDQSIETEGESPKKKRKTRRGKKGKGLASQGPRFILFVGNLPYDVTEADLKSHFKSSDPALIRLRKDKGIAFLEFTNSGSEVRKKIDIALRLHKSVLKGRKINVELTAGGGGNSKERVEKIKVKNEKVDRERLERIIKERDAARKAEKKEENVGDEDIKNKSSETAGIHPSRAALIDQ